MVIFAVEKKKVYARLKGEGNVESKRGGLGCDYLCERGVYVYVCLPKREIRNKGIYCKLWLELKSFLSLCEGKRASKKEGLNQG